MLEILFRKNSLENGPLAEKWQDMSKQIRQKQKQKN